MSENNTQWPFGSLAPGSYRMWSTGDGWGDVAITEDGRLLVRQNEVDGSPGTDWTDMTSTYPGASWDFDRVDPHPSRRPEADPETAGDNLSRAESALTALREALRDADHADLESELEAIAYRLGADRLQRDIDTAAGHRLLRFIREVAHDVGYELAERIEPATLGHMAREAFAAKDCGR